MRDYLPDFMASISNANTRAAYRSDVLRFFKNQVITQDVIHHVTADDVARYVAALRGEYKVSTVSRHIASLKVFFDWATSQHIIPHSPFKEISLNISRSTSLANSTAAVVLSPAQVDRLLSATTQAGQAEVRDRALIGTLLHCALRRSEAAAIDVSHIRRAGNAWTLDIPGPRGGTGVHVRIPGHVAEEIERMKAHYGIVDGPLWRSLSNNGRGNRLSAKAIYEIVKRTALRAGLSTEIGAHTLRHTGCTLAIEAGASLQQVQAHARHKHIETTMIYVHQRDRLRDSAADYIHVKK